MTAATSKNSLKYTLRNTQHLIRVVCCVLFSLLAACAPVETTPFIPPPLQTSPTVAATTISLWTVTPEPGETDINAAETPAANSTEEPQSALPSPTPACLDSLRFLADLTIPDGTLVVPGERIDKQWQVQNDGTCDWDGRYTLKVVGGFPPLGADVVQTLYPARAGSEAIIQVIFTGPLSAGIYRSAWQAYDPDGNPFGDTVYIEVVVQ